MQTRFTCAEALGHTVSFGHICKMKTVIRMPKSRLTATVILAGDEQRGPNCQMTERRREYRNLGRDVTILP